MKLSTFAIIVTLLAGLFGLAFIFIPAQLATFYGVTQNPAGLWVSRYWGAALVFIAMIYWSYSGVTPAAKSWPKLLIFSIIYDGIQLVLTVLALTSGVGNSNGWSTVGLYALLIIGSIYFLGVCNKARAKAVV
ncbi:MAG TPA: hypothetical protein VG367_00910 [Mucilaginibacter sp.]|jgi:hypothetical protein|nr:hypothetical protein [Mucilaginibacter sp.]